MSTTQTGYYHPGMKNCMEQHHFVAWIHRVKNKKIKQQYQSSHTILTYYTVPGSKTGFKDTR